MAKKVLRQISLILMDIGIYVGCWVLTLMLLGHRISIRGFFISNAWYLLGGAMLVVAGCFFLKLYSVLLSFASIREAINVIIIGLLMFGYNLILSYVSHVIRLEWALIHSFLFMIAIVISRFAYRFYLFFVEYLYRLPGRKDKAQRVLIIGAGSTGISVIREIQKNVKSNMTAVCALDDDITKIGKGVNGVKVVGKISEVSWAVKRYKIDKIILAIPSADKKHIKEVVTECKKTKCQVLTVPSIFNIVDGSVSIKDFKEVSIVDLLGREQVKVNIDEIIRYIEDKVVLVTGGGGSIGSELCRQIASHGPKRLIIVDIYENNAYDIQQELVRRLPNLDLVVLIASVRDKGKIDDIFDKYRPEIVFHAAAHKHVPLMETSPNEAVKNNVCGTFNVADAAGRFGVERFVLISTDKAVNPTNIMGASKRICEMIIQTINKKYDTDYVAVRFGNVLGSNGSVIPLFKRQIEEGGPITVTHKDIVRYFMTIPEAVSLVLQAGAYAKGGEIFVLNMGEPIHIYDLAVNMIRLSGLTPFKDIDIQITGLRPGEKLYEEMLMSEEGLNKTDNEMIFIGHPLDIDEHSLFDTIQEMKKLAYEETDKMKDVVHQLVPTYKIDRRKA